MSLILQQGPVAKLPTAHGIFNITIFRDKNLLDHAVIYLGNLQEDKPLLTRVHSECLTGDALGSLRCDCGFQLNAALAKIAKAQRGALLYMRQEGRGIGLFNKIRAYKLQDEGLDTVEANLKLGFPSDGRSYHVCADILKELEVKQIILMTNNPKKIEDLKEHGINVVDREPLEYGRNTYNEGYLNTKEIKMGHILHHQD